MTTDNITISRTVLDTITLALENAQNLAPCPLYLEALTEALAAGKHAREQTQVERESFEQARARGVFKPALDCCPPNEAGATPCVVRWMVATPKGWLGAYDKDAFSAYIAAARTQPVLEPLTEEQRKELWHGTIEAHSKWTAYAWFSYGIRQAEAAHGIK